ncbi:MAG: helix-turn-helix domain-containing protein, partial [Phototrophicaceae bacterium]
PKKAPVGISDPKATIATLQNEISTLISPTLNVEIDTQETQGKTIIRVQVPLGDERPYAIDNTKIYVRDEADTSIAIRDEIVSMVKQAAGQSKSSSRKGRKIAAEANAPVPADDTGSDAGRSPISEPDTDEPLPSVVEGRVQPPRSGVEIVGIEQRGDTRYYIMRDLRNGNVVKNVTKSSARRLWHYAIKQKESNPVREDSIQWQGDVGLWRRYKKSGTVRYDLVQRENGTLRVYYGATENGMHGPWQQFLGPEDSN